MTEVRLEHSVMGGGAAAYRALISLLFLPAMHDGGEKEADRAGRL